MKVLIAEDDDHIRTGLAEILEREGYQTALAADGNRTLEVFERESPDFVCLDIMMPGMNGYDVCREIRRRDAGIPIVFITAKSEEVDKVIGLEIGADDFIVKPFGVREVVARIRAITRRCMASRPARPSDQTFRLKDVEVLPAELRARRGDEVIDLSLREVNLLRLFHDNQGKALDRDTIFNRCWGIDYLPSSRTLDQHIAQLRKKIETDPKDPTIIRTVHGVGYRYDG
jgi:DNA-binding response OmpR family regulator